ncbi:hypothetical protein BC938DRAFT_479256 [Jimgerdemannia flammicorona]|uniref:Uncharacterized protein n=1 Tax=Jimgerdemannia flammicorona TaxID=994334 RepID=A0A433QL83_9FUNG|nr:hypothetical protein BC938DRAFT_479256 [Jimgerdemannia flammicorona]
MSTPIPENLKEDYFCCYDKTIGDQSYNRHSTGARQVYSRRNTAVQLAAPAADHPLSSQHRLKETVMNSDRQYFRSMAKVTCVDQQIPWMFKWVYEAVHKQVHGAVHGIGMERLEEPLIRRENTEAVAKAGRSAYKTKPRQNYNQALHRRHYHPSGLRSSRLTNSITLWNTRVLVASISPL